jgi:hypothetical protein
MFSTIIIWDQHIGSNTLYISFHKNWVQRKKKAFPHFSFCYLFIFIVNIYISSLMDIGPFSSSVVRS